MARGTHRTDTGVADLLADPRFEVMPFDSFDDQVAHLAEGAKITVTASPTLGLEATIEKAEYAAERGYEVIPHVAARYVREADHAAEIADRLAAVGITDVFVPGGDREEPIGEFESAYSLLSTYDELGYEWNEVGITGYPEGHPFLDEATLRESMEQKRPYATYVATQLCYDPGTVLTWIDSIRDRGVDLPVEVGIPGVMKYSRLLEISQRVGVGDSIRFLRKTSGILGFLRQIVGSRGTYEPDALVDGLAAGRESGDYGIRNLHIYTFNQVADTEAWRRERLGPLD